MKNIEKLKEHEYSYDTTELADKVNELVDRVNELSKPVETTNEQPTYCKAKSTANNPGYPLCQCFNFCKFDNIQFDTILG